MTRMVVLIRQCLLFLSLLMPLVALASEPAFPIEKFEIDGEVPISDSQVKRVLGIFVGDDRKLSDLQSAAKALEEALYPPPRLSLAIDTAPYTLSKWKAAELKTTAAWTVARAKNELTLALVVAKTKHRAAVVTVPVGLGRKLRADLVRCFRARALPKQGDAPVTESGMYLYPYALKDKKLRLERKLALHVMPRYVGSGEGGKRIVDERITFVVVDAGGRRWPVMTKLNQAAAKALIEGLNAALKR